MGEVVKLNDLRRARKLPQAFWVYKEDALRVSTLLTAYGRTLDACELASRVKSPANQGSNTIVIPEILSKAIVEAGYCIHEHDVSHSWEGSVKSTAP